MEKFTVRERGDRKHLLEGRRYQMGFTILRKLITKPVYVSLYPFSSCKDYLNDFCFTSKTGLTVEVYGIETKPTTKIGEEDKVLLGIRILKYPNGDEYGHPEGFYGPHKDDVNRLHTNLNNILKAVNHFDTIYNVPLTTASILEDGTCVFEINKFWFEYGYRVSFYTLMIRLFQFWNGEGTIDDFIKNYSNPLDLKLLNESREHVELFLKGEKLPDFDFSNLKQTDLCYNVWGDGGGKITYNMIHNSGLKGMLKDCKELQPYKIVNA